MKVQLIFAPPQQSPKYGELGQSITPPLGILYLAGYLRRELPEVELSVIDGLKSGYDRTLSAIESFDPDILGISFYTPVALSAYRLINQVKEALPNTFIVAGGPHATALPREVLERSGADVVAIGEGEVTLSELVRMLAAKKLPSHSDYERIDGLAYRSSGRIKKTPPRRFIPDINDIPFPARDLVDLSEYSGWYVHHALPETKMLFSRGCPYHCTFCDAVIWKSSKPWVRLRTPENIVDEIEVLMKEFGVREIMDDSDEFNNSEAHAIAICEEIKRRGVDIPWKTQLRAWPLSEKLVRAMAESGCWYVHLGIESGNPETLRGIQKHITVEQVREACARLKKYDIKILGLFMLFNVWEEDGELRFEDVKKTENTFRFIESLINEKLLDYIGWSVTTPYPGSKLYEIALNHDLIKPRLLNQWDAWITDDAYVMRLPGVDEREMIRMKTLGQILRAKLIVKSRRFGYKDIPFFIQKGLKLLHDEVRSRFANNGR
ncbi:MAG: B12-binding domain-containing radical SAM protein [Actinobacteria bacterium]|nr:B12-binding domain-containing radical SAM protein [Actinomycetota bacterium]